MLKRIQKRLVALMLCCLLLPGIACCEAAGDLIAGAYAAYIASAERFEQIDAVDAGQRVLYPARPKAADALLISCDFFDQYVGEALTRDNAAAQIGKKVLYASIYAMNRDPVASDDAYFTLPDGVSTISIAFAWLLPVDLPEFGETAYAAAVLLCNRREPLDDSVYLVVGGAGEESGSRTWVCSDSEVVAPALHGLYEMAEAGFIDLDSEFDAHVRAWLSEKESALDLDALADAMRTGDKTAEAPVTELVLGTVHFIHGGTNVRAGAGTEFEQIAKIPQGAIYPCVGVSDTGWLQILFPDGTTGFVSPKMVEFRPVTEK